MTTNFQINGVDWDDTFIRRDIFIEGGAWTWGLGAQGELGNGVGGNTSTVSSPVQVISGGSNWRSISVGDSNALGIKTDGTLWTWGNNPNGELGDGTRVRKSSPVQTLAGGNNWRTGTIGSEITGAITTNGTLWMWGSNVLGSLGDNTNTGRSSPVQTISGGTNWKDISLGYQFSGAIKTDGTLWTWGRNVTGDLGDGTVTPRSSPVQTVSGGNNWKQISCSEWSFTAAIKTDGTLWLWGLNTKGALGNNDSTETSKSSPIQTVAGGTNWKSVDCRGELFVLAIKNDGTLWTWGSNSYGTLGDNTIIHRSSPVQTIAGGANWKFATAGLYHSCAIKTDGTLWTWGFNSDGQLGDNTRTQRSSPVQTISGGTNWKTVTAGFEHTAAIREDYYR